MDMRFDPHDFLINGDVTSIVSLVRWLCVLFPLYPFIGDLRGAIKINK